ncbi:meiotically up-regulated gene 113-domain-containing protein [Aspergillus californicus]
MANTEMLETPKRSASRYEEDDPSFVSGLSTPLLSLTSPEGTLFSPNESLSSEATEATDYGWDTPTSGTPRKRGHFSSTPIPPILIQAATRALNETIQARSSVSILSSVSAVECPEAGLDADHESERSNAGGTAEGPSKSTDTTERLSLLRIFSTLDVSKRSVRRQSFSPTPDYNFTAQGLVFETRYRSRSMGTIPTAHYRSATTPFLSRQATGSEIRPQPADLGAETAASAVRPTTSTGNKFVGGLAKEDLAFRELLARLLPVSTRELLIKNASQCVATTKEGKRCKRPTPSGRGVLGLLDKARTSQMADTIALAKSILKLALCGRTHRGDAEGILSETWHSSMTLADRLLVLKHQVEIIAAGSKETPIIKTEPENSITADDPGLTRTLQFTAPRAILPALDLASTPALPHFVPYILWADRGRPMTERLRKLIESPLAPGDVSRKGLIYIYQCRGKFGYFKIGYTMNVRVRLQDWEKQCGRKLWCYFPLEEPDTTPVLHINRVEKLIHTELAAYRRQEMKCAGAKCGKKHIEWFEVGDEVATKVVRKWMAWMRELPYEPRAGRNGQIQWFLREEQMQKLDVLCAVSETSTPKSALAMSSRLRPPTPRREGGRRKSMNL